MSSKDSAVQKPSIEERKKALKDAIAQSEGQFQSSIGAMKDELSVKKDPRYWIKKYPFAITSGALLVGLLVGKKRKTTKIITQENGEFMIPAKDDSFFKTMVLDSLKKKALQFAMQKGTEYVQTFLQQKMHEAVEKVSKRDEKR